MRSFALCALAVSFLAVACSSSSDSPPDEDDAILSRASLGTHTCSVERPHTRYTPTQNSIAGPSLAVTAAGKAFIARIDSPFPYPEPVDPPALFVAPIGADGAMGPRVKPDDRSPDMWGSPTIARYGDGLAIAWSDEERLRVAALGPDGAVVKAPVNLSGVTLRNEIIQSGVLLAQGKDGRLGLAYTTEDDTATNNELRFVVLDDAFTPAAAPRTIGKVPKGYPVGAELLAAGDGYAFVWTGMTGEDQAVYFATTDAGGAEETPARRLSAEGRKVISYGFESLMLALVETPSGFAAAWVEYSERSTAVRVAKLASDGTPVGNPVVIRRSEDAADEVEPSLALLGDALAILWARGSHIFECGGCVPDHRIDLLLVDPETLDPLSDVVSVERTALGPQYQPSGGLLSRASVVLGSKILAVYHQQYHTTADLASATFACAKR